MAGITSRRSLQQYGAVARMRLRLLANSVRTGRGRVDVVAQGMSWITYVFLGSIFAFGFASGSYYVVGHPQDARYFSLVLWGALLMWQGAPIMTIAFREEQDLTWLTRFPLGFGSYYILFLFLGLFDLSTIFGLASLLGIALGVGLAQAALLPILLPALALFAIFNIFLNRALFAWLNRWLAQRRTREILGIVFFLIVMAGELMNPSLHLFHAHVPVDFLYIFKKLEPLDAALPPGLITGAMLRAAQGRLFVSALSLVGMTSWTILPGALLGFRLWAQYRGENLSQASPRKTEVSHSAATRSTRFDVTGPIAAVMVKEARYLMRSYQLLYGLVAPLILMLLFTGSPHHQHGSPWLQAHFLLPMAVIYAFLGLTRLIFNSLGSEGTGLQFYFSSPVPFWKVILGKNLFHLCLLSIEIAVLWVIAFLRVGPPSLEEIGLTLCAIAFIVPANFLAANLLSLHAPYRMNLSRLGRPQGATASNLFSLLLQLIVAGICALVYFAARGQSTPWLAAIILLGLGIITSAAYWIVLLQFDELAKRRIEPLLTDLARTAS